MSVGTEFNYKYKVEIRRDENMMRTFIKFSNRVRHPRVTVYMLIVGISLILLPFAQRGIKQPGVTISIVMGVLLTAMGLFRQNISIWMMKSDPAVKLNEELTYIFGNTQIRAIKGAVIENMGSYSKIYRVWEDEKHFYVGMNEEDLLILPKMNFSEGDAKTFRDFILEKSGADFRWQPTGFVNICKHKWMNFQMKMMERDEEEDNKKGKKQ